MIEAGVGISPKVGFGHFSIRDRAEIDDIKNALREIRARVNALLIRSNLKTLDEDQTASIPPLTPDQLRKRNERDTNRRERIAKINSAAQEKTREIRQRFGK